MVDWFNVNFQSSFSNTGEFTNRTASVVSPKSCEDCKVSAITFENQRKILLKQDSQIQESHKKQKASNDENKKLRSKTKSLEAQLEETTSLLETAMDESASEITALKAELKTKIDLLEAKSQNTLKSPKQNAQNTNEIEVSMEKCKSCGFSSKSKEVIKQHMMSRHGVKFTQQGVFRCLMCPETFKDKQNFKKHKAEHQRELDVITFEHVCKECSLSFGSREDYLEHLLEKHRPKSYRPTEKKSEPKQSKKFEECDNGPSCKWFKMNKCKFEHNEQAWKTVHHKKQSKQKNASAQPQQTKTKYKEPCRNGLTCKFKKQDRCNFFHKETKHQEKHQNQDYRSDGQEHDGERSELRKCKFGRRCDKGRDCGFLHLPKDFLPLTSGRRN